VPLWNDERVALADRSDVRESQDSFVFIDYARGRLPADDFTENAVFSQEPSPCP
jgi:hypothetical protein